MDFSSVFGPMYNGFVDALNTLVIGNYAAFVGIVAGPLRIGMIIYIILLGGAIMRGAVQYPFREYVFRALQLALLYWAITSLYGGVVANMIVEGLPAQFAGALGVNVAGVGDLFDSFVARSLALVMEINADLEREMRGASFTEMPGVAVRVVAANLLLMVVVIVTYLAAAVGFVFAVFAVFALAALAVVGPLFFGALLFAPTRGFFFSWLGAVINYLMLALFAMLLALAITGIAELVVTDLNADGPILANCALLIGFYAVAGFFFFQIPSLAASLGGGGPALATQFAAAIGSFGTNVIARTGSMVGMAGSRSAALAGRVAGPQGNRITRTN